MRRFTFVIIMSTMVAAGAASGKPILPRQFSQAKNFLLGVKSMPSSLKKTITGVVAVSLLLGTPLVSTSDTSTTLERAGDIAPQQHIKQERGSDTALEIEALLTLNIEQLYQALEDLNVVLLALENMRAYDPEFADTVAGGREKLEEMQRAAQEPFMKLFIQDLSREAGYSALVGWSDGAHGALLNAARKGHTQMAKLLIEAGTDLDIQDENNNTALTLAAYQGHTQIAELLIDAGANLDIQNDSGYTALIRAARKGHTQIAKLLIYANADLDIQNNWGYTALMRAAFEGHTQIAKLLIYANADLDIQNDSGYTALYWANANHGNRARARIAKMLRREGARK